MFTWLYWNQWTWLNPTASSFSYSSGFCSCFMLWTHLTLWWERVSQARLCTWIWIASIVVKSHLFLPSSLLAERVTNDSEEWVNKSQLPLVVYGLQEENKTKKQGGGNKKKWNTRLSCVAIEGTHACDTNTNTRNKHKKEHKNEKNGQKKTSVGGQWTKSAYSERCISSDICTPCRRRPAAPTYHRRQHSVSIILVNQILSISQVNTARPASGGPPHPPHPCERGPIQKANWARVPVTESRAITEIDGKIKIKIKIKMKKYQI